MLKVGASATRPHHLEHVQWEEMEKEEGEGEERERKKKYNRQSTYGDFLHSDCSCEVIVNRRRVGRVLSFLPHLLPLTKGDHCGLNFEGSLPLLQQW